MSRHQVSLLISCSRKSQITHIINSNYFLCAEYIYLLLMIGYAPTSKNLVFSGIKNSS